MDKNIELVYRHFSRPQEDAKARRGIVFAISGLACAIAGPTPSPGEGIDLTVLMKSGGSLLDFSPLIAPTIAVRPDFVVIQSTMLVLAEKNGRPNALKDARSFWRRQVLSLMPGFIPDGAARRKSVRKPTRMSLFSRCLARKEIPREQLRDDLTRMTVGFTARILPPEDRRRDQVRAILLRFAEAGIPVLVVTPPLNRFSEAYYAKMGAEAQSVVGPIMDSAKIFFLAPPNFMPSQQFRDALHLDPNQNESYRAWLADAVVAALEN